MIIFANEEILLNLADSHTIDSKIDELNKLLEDGFTVNKFSKNTNKNGDKMIIVSFIKSKLDHTPPIT